MGGPVQARMRRVRSFAARAACLGALAATTLAGCFADPTEVVVVIDSDAQQGRDFAQVDLCFSSGGQFSSVAVATAPGTSWPVTVGALEQTGSFSPFTVMVTLSTTLSVSCGPGFGPGVSPPFATRTAMDVNFVDGQMRVLFLPLLRKCACVDAAGTPISSCASALEPDCRDLRNPQLGDFDESNLPRIPASARSP